MIWGYTQGNKIRRTRTAETSNLKGNARIYRTILLSSEKYVGIDFSLLGWWKQHSSSHHWHKGILVCLMSLLKNLDEDTWRAQRVAWTSEWVDIYFRLGRSWMRLTNKFWAHYPRVPMMTYYAMWRLTFFCWPGLRLMVRSGVYLTIIGEYHACSSGD